MSNYVNKKAKNLTGKKETYVISLNWYIFEEGDESKKEKKEQIDSIKPGGNYTLSATYVSPVNSLKMVGFASTDDAEKGMKPLALAILASIKVDNWIGLYKFDDNKYYVLAFVDSVVHIDTDILLPMEEAVELFNNIIKEYDIPADYVFKHTESAPDAQKALIKLIDPSKQKKVPKLSNYEFKLSNIHPLAYLVIGGLILGGGGFGYYQYSEMKKEEARLAEEKRNKMRAFLAQENAETTEKKKELLAEIEKLESMTQSRYEQLFAQAKTKKPEPWNQKMMPSTFFDVCMPAIETTELIKSTWKIDTIECTGDQLVTTYLRSGIVDVGRFFLEHPDAQIDDAGEVATFVKKLGGNNPLANTSIPETPEEYHTAKYNLIGVFQQKENITLNMDNSAFDYGQYYNPFADEVRSYFQENRNQATEAEVDSLEEKTIEDWTIEELEGKLSNLMSEEQIKNLSVDQLPIDYKINLNNYYEKDWTTKTIMLNSEVSIANIGQLLDNIKGIRIDKISASLEATDIEWRVEAPLYLKNSAVQETP